MIKIRFFNAALTIALSANLAFADTNTEQVDELLKYAQQTYDHQPSSLANGMNVFIDVGPSFTDIFNKEALLKNQNLYKHFVDACVSHKDGPGKQVRVNNTWKAFEDATGDKKEKLKTYFMDQLGLTETVALDAVHVLAYIGGGNEVGIDVGKFDEDLATTAGIKAIGDKSDIPPFLCIINQRGVANTVAFASGFFGTPGKRDTHFFYASSQYFAETNQRNQQSTISAKIVQRYLPDAIKRSNEVVAYQFKDNADVVQQVTFRPQYANGRLDIRLHNNRNTPVFFNLRSIPGVTAGKNQYALVYGTYNGGISARHYGDCARVEGNEIVINPNGYCNIEYDSAKVPNLTADGKLPDVDLLLPVLGKTARLQPVHRGF